MYAIVGWGKSYPITVGYKSAAEMEKGETDLPSSKKIYKASLLLVLKIYILH